MGLYDRLNVSKKPRATPSQGLLHKTLTAKANTPSGVVPAGGAAAAGPSSRRHAPPAGRPKSASTEPRESIESRIARLGGGFDAPLLLFELVVRELGPTAAALLVADYPRAALVPCAVHGAASAGTGVQTTEVLERLLEQEKLFALSREHATLLRPAVSSSGRLWLRSFRRNEVPVGAFLLAPANEAAAQALLSHGEISALLQSCSDQLSGFPPVSLQNLDGVRPAGPSMLLSVSCDDIVAVVGERAPSLNRPWLEDLLQRMLAVLLAPLGRVGTHSAAPVAVLTERSLDSALLTHQTALVLSRFLRSVRPLPDPVFSPLR